MSFKKGFSVFVSAVFLFSVIFPDLARAVPTATDVVQNISLSDKPVDNSFGGYAQVTSLADYGGDTVVLNIQDFHMHPEVQRNISSLIDVLVKKHAIGKVFVEGAYGKVSTEWLSSLKNGLLGADAIDDLLNSGVITGAEYYSVVNDKKDFLIGLEDEKIHKENIQRLGTLIEKQAYYENAVVALQKELDFFQEKYFSAQNKKLSKLVQKHKDGKISSSKYYALLLEYLEKNSDQSLDTYGALMPMDTADYPNICLLLYSYKMQNSLKVNKTNNDLQNLLDIIKESVSFAEYKNILDQTNNFQDMYQFISYLGNMPEEFKNEHFSANIAKYIDVTNRVRQINPVDLISEERALVQEIRIALSQNKNELEVSFLSDFFLYFSDYLKTSISADDYVYLKGSLGKFQNLWSKYSLYNKTMRDLRGEFAFLNEYYEVNDNRNEIFLEQIRNNAVMRQGKRSVPVIKGNVSAMLKDKKNIIVCVTGGYHSKGLSDLLADEKISYAVITPSVSGSIDGTLENYEQAALEQAKIFSQTLALSLFSQVVLSAILSDNPEAKQMAARLFINAANNLENVDFEYVGTFIDILNEAVGKDYVFAYNAESGEVTLSSSDGKYSEPFIEVRKNSEGKISIKNKYSLEYDDKVMFKDNGKLFTAAQMKEFLTNLGEVLQISTFNLGSYVFLPQIYSSSVNLINWAAKNNLFLDIDAINGISFEIAERYGFDEKILNDNPVVAKYYEQWQTATLRKYLKEEDFENGNMTDYSKLLFAAGLLNEFLPISNDTLAKYDRYPASFALNSVKESDFMIETSATITKENFLNPAVLDLIDSLIEEKHGEKVRVAYIQTPLQQLRTEATFNAAFKDKIKEGTIEGISVTDSEFYRTKDEAYLTGIAAGEFIRLIIYSLIDDIRLEINDEKSIFGNRLPKQVWIDMVSLIESSENKGKIISEIKAFVVGMKNGTPDTVFKTKQSIIDVLESKYEDANSIEGAKIFLNYVYDGKLPEMLNARANINEIAALLTESQSLSVDNPADILLVCGNDETASLRVALNLYLSGIVKRVIISGGFGKGTVPLLRRAVEMGIDVKISDTETISTIAGYEKIERLNDDEKKERIKISEAEIARLIMLHYAEAMGIDVEEEAPATVQKANATPSTDKNTQGINTPNLVLIGAPASGKGTSAVVIADAMGLAHISTGDIFRANSEKAKKLKARKASGEVLTEAEEETIKTQDDIDSYVNAKELVPDTITNKIVFDRLSESDVEKGFILDGFPRTRAQAKALDDFMAARGKRVSPVFIDAEFEVLLERMHLRVQQALERGDTPRKDDTPEGLEKRHQVFLDETMPVITYYRNQFNISEYSVKEIIEEGSANSSESIADSIIKRLRTIAETNTDRKATIEDIDIQPGQKFIVRVDYNVPMENGRITDDTRITATLDTIKYITERGGKVVLMAHLGRPDGESVREFSLAPIAKYLENLLGQEVTFFKDATKKSNASKINAMENGSVALLENVRFYAGEEKNDEAFAKKLAANVGSDAVFVMDAFGAAHRAHSSTVGISKFVSKSVAGLLMSKELQFLGKELENPKSPSVAIIGGSKVKDKIGVINTLIEKVDTIIIGGAMAYSFLAAQGTDIGKSLADEENIALAKEILAKAEAAGKSIALPEDHKVVKSGTIDFANYELTEGNDLHNTRGVVIEGDYMGVDIGEKTFINYAGIITKAKTVLWNGPMGVFEVKELSEGTTLIAKALVVASEENGAVTIVGGGDSVAAVNKTNLSKRISHVSTGGGASLEFLEKGTLPAVENLDDLAVNQTEEWKDLEQNQREMADATIQDLFKSDPDRRTKEDIEKNYIRKLQGKNAGMALDTSFSNTDKKTMKLLMDLARKRDLKGFIKRMMSGDKINTSEKRAVLHTALRNVEKDEAGNIVSKGPVYVDGVDVMPDIVRVLEQMRAFDRKLENKELVGVTGKPIKTIISIGIGGSDLGPRMATAALERYKREGVEVRYVSNVDPRAAQLAMKDLDPETTMVIVESKTFTTQETIENAKTVRSAMVRMLRAVDPSKSVEDIVSKHFIAVSTARKEVKEFGIDVISEEEINDEVKRRFNDPANTKTEQQITLELKKEFSESRTDNIFEFWDFVGGRYSIWSAIGLPLVAAMGFDNYFEMLQGANVMDTHFAEADYEENIPIRLAMIWVWYINFFKYDVHSIIPYSEDLRLFPKYTQQLYMESLGKSVTKEGKKITDYATGATIFGESGTDSQHSFFQMFHQGTGIIPIDFITYMEPPAIRENMSAEEKADVQRRHGIFLSNVFAQREAYAMGRSQEEVDAEVEKVMNNVINKMIEEGAGEEAISYERERYEKLKLQKSFDGNRPTNLITFDRQNPESFGMLIALYEHITAVQSQIWDINAFDQWGVELGKVLAKALQKVMFDGAPMPFGFSVTTNYWMGKYLGTSMPQTVSHWLSSKIVNFMWTLKSFTFAASKKIERLTETKQWTKLQANFETIKNKSIKDLFKEDSGRKNVKALVKNYIRVLKGKNVEMALDTSFSNTDKKTMKLLMDLARKRDVRGFVKRMMSGEKINESENRAVLHTALRNVERDANGNILSKGPIYVDGKDVMPDIVRVLEQMREFDRKLENKELLGATGKPIKTVVSIGIGGSDLGPKMATAALERYQREGVEVRYVSNVDPRAPQLAMDGLDPETTMVIVESKTFTTQETIENAKAARSEFIKMFRAADPSKSVEEIVSKHFVAVSTAREIVSDFGIDVLPEEEAQKLTARINDEIERRLNEPSNTKTEEEITREVRKEFNEGLTDNIFEFWDFVGGRYSIWSAIGLPLASAVGFDNYFEMLTGANVMDTHFAEADYEDNIPIRLAMIWIWYINFFKYDAHAIIPYSEDLRLFPKYTQQLYMESLGKSTDMDGNRITDYETAAAIFGESGTDSQHSFFQLFHQGTGIVPIDFITYMEPPALREDMSDEEKADIQRRHGIFLSNVFAQREAFAMGRSQEEVDAEVEAAMNKSIEKMKEEGKSEEDISYERERYEKLKLQKSFDGNRPSNFITFDKQTPESLGMIIALYEHITAVQARIWNINAFDQWGVELGKIQAKGLQPTMEDREKAIADGKEIGDEFSTTTHASVDNYEKSKGQAIMEKNYPRVYASLLEGNSAFGTVLRMFMAEYPIARKDPTGFIYSHRDEDLTAAADFAGQAANLDHNEVKYQKPIARIFTVLIAVTAAIFIAPSVTVFGLAAFTGLIIITGFSLTELVFTFKDVKKYFSIDYRFVKGLKSDLERYSPVMTEKEMAEADHIEAIVINSAPAKPQELGFKPTGLKTSDGKTIWASKKTGRLVIFAQSDDLNRVALSVSDVVPAILNKKGDKFEISAIAVDETAGMPKNLNYFDDLLVIKKSYYDELLALANYDVKVAGEKIRNEKEAGQNAAARNFVMDLSSVESSDNIKDVIRALSGYNKTGNSQIAVPYSFIEKLASGKFEMDFKGKNVDSNERNKKIEEIKKEIVSEWSNSGLRVFAVMDENTADRYNMQARFIDFGFAGYIEKENGKIKTLRDYTSESDAPFAEIANFTDVESLEKQIENSRPDAVKVVNVLNYTELITNGEADIASKVLELSNMFGRNIVKIFKKTINEQYVTDAVLDFNMNAIPSIGAADMEVLHKAVAEFERAQNELDLAVRNNKSASQIAYAQGKFDGAYIKALEELKKIPVNKSIELNMLNMEILENAEEADIEKVQYAFLKTVAQKAKVKADLYSDSPLGLEDKDLERLFVKSALSEYAVDNNIIISLEQDLTVPQTKDGEILSEGELRNIPLMEDRTMSLAFEGNSSVMTARQAYDAVSVRAKDIALRDTAATATVYEMILLYAERKTDTKVSDKTLSIDTKAITTLLAQA